MRITQLFAIASLAVLPLGATAAVAAPGAGEGARTIAKIDAKPPIIDVRRGGGGRGVGGRGMRAGRGIGSGGRKFSGGNLRGRVLKYGNYGNAGRVGRPSVRGPRGPGRSYAHRGGRHHNHYNYRRRFGGYPYYYAPSYYYDDPYYYGDTYYYDDDYNDGPVVYAEDGDAVARCRARYQSFDPSDGTFLSTDGTRKLCPYLR